METHEQAEQTTEEPKKKRRGFAALDRTRLREIARMGGTAAHRKGTAHRFTREEAKQAGQKGGKAPHRSRGRAKAPPPAEGGGAGAA